MPILRAAMMALLAVVLICGGTRWAGTMSISNFLPLDRRPEVMEDRAQAIIKEWGYTEDAYAHRADSAWGFIVSDTVLKEFTEADSACVDWSKLKERPDAYSYWYRHSQHQKWSG
ncbi:MAG: hypothetical protein ACI8S7_000920 [Candidatus Krumholzibacteriia bacterium]|jgi:hypothetical protein